MKKIFSMNRFEGWNLSLPLIQGGMGVGVSLSGLAGAVASEGGMGVISTAQIGFEEPDFVGNEEACNLRSIRKHIVRAKELASGKGMIAVNVMVALQQYREHVKEAVRAGADAVICGAGLPVDLPELVEAGKAKIAPIVSSRRAAAGKEEKSIMKPLPIKHFSLFPPSNTLTCIVIFIMPHQCSKRNDPIRRASKSRAEAE
jgi:NAD(P)H-dependent flavin oxidoreductase YrpB (nitropropane dioxygenase family)